MTTFQEFIKDRNLSCDTVYTGPTEDDTMFEWVVIIKLGKKKMKVDYRMGLAHCKVREFAGMKGFYFKNAYKIRTISRLEQVGTVIPNKPDLADVLQSIQLDSMAADDYTDKWDFMAEFGYEDGREGERIYKACKRQAKKAREFFGPLYDEFMQLEEE